MRRWFKILFLLASLLWILPAYADDRDPDLQVRLWPNPSTAARGDLVRYDITIDNNGAGRSSRTRVAMPFPKDQFSFVKVELKEKSTWVMELNEERIVIMFGTLRGGERREAHVYLRVAPHAAADGRPISIKATVNYDEISGRGLKSNETFLTITGATIDTKPTVTVDQAVAPVGTLLHFQVSNFFPEEKVFTWLNTADGVAETRLNDTVSEQGSTVLDFDTKKLAPGDYSLVIYGGASNITIVVPFTLR